MKIIMNPPYNGNYHLKVLSNMIEQCPDGEIISLSPVRWLQDPLAEYKKNSDFTKFEDIRKHTEDLEVIPAEDSNKLFNINFGDLGIYHLTKNGGWENTLNEVKPFVGKILQRAAIKSIMDIATEEAWRGEYKGIFGVINSHYGDTGSFIKDDYELFCSPRYTNTNKVLFFSSEDERKSMFKYLTSPLLKAFAKEIRVNQRVPWQLVPALPDYTHLWSDEQLYKFFSLTPEEIKEIEEAIK